MRGPDENGVRLPRGFTSRVIAGSRRPVGRTSYEWHDAPASGGCVRHRSGWSYISNSADLFSGGTAAIRFAAAGEIVSASSLLFGTHMIRAGCVTPWNTWLCFGWVADRPLDGVWPLGPSVAYELDPAGRMAPKERTALGGENDSYR